MEGWIKLYRKIMENPYYFSEKFCRSMAWVDLLLLANHAPGFYYIRGIRVNVAVGQIGHGIDTLSKRWKWSRNKIERWLRELEKDNQIVRQKSNVTTLITIVNYSIYQDKGKADDNAEGKAEGKADGRKQEERRIIKNVKNVIPPTLEMVSKYCTEKNSTVNPEHFFNYYESNGWLVGKNRMKNWQATIKSWEIRDKKNKQNEIVKPIFKKGSVR
jgi:hypothetical protein